MDYLTKWAANIISRPSAALKQTVDVDGLRNAHLGPRWEYAKVRLRVEPSSNFDVQFDLRKTLGADLERFVEAAIMGFLDVVLVTWSSPLSNIRITVLDVLEHEVDSNERAFRMAGRDAGQKLLAVLSNQNSNLVSKGISG